MALVLKQMDLDQNVRQTLNLYDFHKAFDSVSHVAIKEMFVYLKAPVFILNLIASMYINFTIQVNTGQGLTAPV